MDPTTNRNVLPTRLDVATATVAHSSNGELTPDGRGPPAEDYWPSIVVSGWLGSSGVHSPMHHVEVTHPTKW